MLILRGSDFVKLRTWSHEISKGDQPGKEQGIDSFLSPIALFGGSRTHTVFVGSLQFPSTALSTSSMRMMGVICSIFVVMGH